MVGDGQRRAEKDEHGQGSTEPCAAKDWPPWGVEGAIQPSADQRSKPSVRRVAGRSGGSVACEHRSCASTAQSTSVGADIRAADELKPVVFPSKKTRGFGPGPGQ